MGTAYQIYPSVCDVVDRYRGILLDAYGVFWAGGGSGLLPRAKETMEHLMAKGKIVGVLSNSTQLAGKEREKYRSHGVIEGVHFHFIITSGEVAKHTFINGAFPFETPKKKFWLFSDVHPNFSPPHHLFQGSEYQEARNIEEADFIYISIPHIGGEDQIDPERFREEIIRVKALQLPMVCANPDLFAHEGNPPRAVVRQGSIAAMYEEMGGYVFYIGKPMTKAFATAMDEFHRYDIKHPSEVLMVGDTPETDIRGARNFGMSSALVIRTGIMADRIERHGGDTLIAQLPPHDYPDFIIDRFGI